MGPAHGRPRRLPGRIHRHAQRQGLGDFHLDKDGPYLHVNGSHSAPYVTSIAIEGDWLVIYTDLPAEGAQCSSVTVSPDETIAGLHGVIGGASGGNNRTRVRLYSTSLGRRLRLSRADDYNLIAGSTSNLWMTWVHTTGEL